MSNLTVIVDVNYLAHKCLPIVKGFDKNKYSETKKFLDKEKDINSFISMMTTNLLYSLNAIEGYTKLILVKDSKSWRKTFYSEYKARRASKDDTNFDNFYIAINKFLELFKNNGAIVSIIPEAEGDDLLYLWSNYLNNKSNPDSVIIFSGDGDLKQLVNHVNGVYTLLYDTKSKNNTVFAKKGFIEWIKNKNEKSNDIFSEEPFDVFSQKGSINIANEFLFKYDIIEIDPSETILNKVICGDDGDNIPSIWSWGSIKENGNFQYRMTNKHYVKVLEHVINTHSSIEIEELIHNNIFRNRVRLILSDISNTNIDGDLFKEKIERNIKLIYLHKNFIPSSIVDSFNKEKEHLYNVKYIPLNRSILNNTPYLKQDNKEIISDIFSMY